MPFVFYSPDFLEVCRQAWPVESRASLRRGVLRRAPFHTKSRLLGCSARVWRQQQFSWWQVRCLVVTVFVFSPNCGDLVGMARKRSGSDLTTVSSNPKIACYGKFLSYSSLLGSTGGVSEWVVCVWVCDGRKWGTESNGRRRVVDDEPCFWVVLCVTETVVPQWHV